MTTVAQTLKRERETQGISLDEVAQRTYIKLHYLHALEDDRPDLLPAPVYTCGYIRQYAKLLGLNGADLVNIYQQQHKPRDFSASTASPALAPETRIEPAADHGEPLTATVAAVFDDAVPMSPEIGVLQRSAAPAPASTAAPTPAYQARRPQAPEPVAEAPAELPSFRAEVRELTGSLPEVETILAQARQQAEEILARARDEAARLRQGAEQYADQVLMQLETDVSRTLAVIKNGRSHLQTRQRGRRSPERAPEAPST